jgi:hypothetical protein
MASALSGIATGSELGRTPGQRKRSAVARLQLGSVAVLWLAKWRTTAGFRALERRGREWWPGEHEADE